jgi:hypothetical protein
VELFKAGDISFKGAESVAEGSGKPLGSGKLEEKAPNANGKTLLNGNQFEPFQGKVIGSNNVVSPNATGFFVQGDGNTVGASKNVTLIGSNCVVANGVQNVTAIGVQGVTISKSDTVINGTGGIQQAKLTMTAAEVLALNSTPKAFGLTVPTGYYVQVLSVQVGVDFNTTAYTTNTGIGVRAVGADVQMASHATVLAATVSRIASLPINTSPSAGQTQFIDGADVEVYALSGNPATGDSVVDCYISYLLIEL